MLDLTALWRIADLDRPDLKAPSRGRRSRPPRLVPPDEDEPADVFAADPRRATSSSTTRTSRSRRRSSGSSHQAADDPDVLTIKQTLYRTSGDSPIVQSLIRAAERGKQVVVLVEIKARFDEEANIIWARKLERAGAHVVYGLVGLKTHSKIALVVRREGSGLRRYVHIGTGNYNPKTARLYIDLGLLTVRPEIGADVTDLFNVLTGLSRQRTFRRLLVAPHSLRAGFLELVERETRPRRAPAGRPASWSRSTPSSTRRSSRRSTRRRRPASTSTSSSAARAPLQPGVPGVSERIRVRSIVGEFLEHSRIWGFANGGDPEWYIGSADLMERNLDRRVEAVVPGRGQRGPGPARRDHRRHARRRPPVVAAPAGRDLGPDGGARGARRARSTRSRSLKERALEHGHVATAPAPAGRRGRLLDPRA